MKEVTATAATVEEAVELALAQLGVPRERADIVVIDEGKKGWFGLFGGRPAVVKAVLKIDPVEETVRFLQQVITQMGAEGANIEVARRGKQVTLHIQGGPVGLLIGKHGQTLNALQFLTQLVANRHADEYVSIAVDVENYRERRKQALVELAHKLAARVVKTGKEVKLEPMPAHERKIIHLALAGNKHVSTYSIGVDPHRSIVVSPAAGKKSSRKEAPL
ncbi:RNA-binding cell elongation regulator Jag/EloR [Geobacillus thermodenitrificans]|uniref:RNA-binding cell elongation regulator Jag/EloR n=1 Tax=Geobacillus thermodenitrificans TaxID=33940 RepID=UPI0003FC6911|nr:RNA-binding cell elongation regulator Jag/EloR [Geobacillus thermodenitrificans]ARA98158.1 protein jag [Geobacillus thermodenitrificans]ARP44531.1 Protein jag [Geobacillus thermodenitrificans]